ncbi:MAG: hypothetical protein HZA15_17760 [Nitrospirae bacterium]|nr:hypothetical protein [Nitrospirota bacterium]
MNITTILNHLLRLELMMERLYKHFEKLFVFEREAISLFHALSIEEKAHADMISYQLRLVRNNLKIFPDISYDISPLDSLMAQIDGILSAKRPLTLREAIFFSITAERSAAEFHRKTVIAESNTEVGEHIRNLGSYDEAHDEQLVAFAKKLGIYEEHLV